jgi:hypothetical protein
MSQVDCCITSEVVASANCDDFKHLSVFFEPLLCGSVFNIF